MKRRPASILLVGRNDSLRGVLAAALRSHGFDVTPLNPSVDALPVLAPAAVVYPRWFANGSSDALLSEWQHSFPDARFIEMSFYSGVGGGTPADRTIEVPSRLGDLVRAIQDEIGG